ncbi:MAG: hypothetical protein ACP5N3_01785 [Candidatus Nanoarchaeia archaeon]
MKKKCSKLVFIQAVFLLAILLSSGMVFAAGKFSVSATPILSRITPSEVAAYNLTITNFEAQEGIYTISLGSGDTTNWIITPSLIKVPANSSETEIINIFPKSTTGTGVYAVAVIISAQGEEKQISLPLSMNFEGFYSDYVPNVELTVSAPEVQDARESMKVSVKMTNKNMLDMKNITLYLWSEGLFFKEINTSLGPRKEKTQEFLFDLDPLQKPGTYTINVNVYYPVTDKTVSESETEFRLDQYSAISLKHEYKRNWFIRTDTIVLENIGNFENNKEVSLRMPWFKRVFAHSDTEAQVARIDGKTNLVWNPSIKPMETKTITVTTNYRPLVIILALLILLIVLYFVLRSPVILLKEAGVVEEDEHGISEIKVKLFIKNRSRRTLEQISVSDKVQGITEHIESNTLGSMKPSRITKTTAKGTILHWDLDKLDAFEERIITYKLRSKLKVVGDMTLPRARVKFTYGSGKKERFVVSPIPLFFRQLK